MRWKNKKTSANGFDYKVTRTKNLVWLEISKEGKVLIKHFHPSISRLKEIAYKHYLNENPNPKVGGKFASDVIISLKHKE